MEAPDTEVYAAQYLDDGLGEGFRVYTSRDQVYEARQVDGTEIRVYPDGDGWWMKIRTLAEETEAFDRLQDMADTIGDETGTRPKITVGEFSDGRKRGHVSREAEGFTVQYRNEHGYNLDIPTSRLAKAAGSTVGFGHWVGVTGGACGALGAGVGGLLGAAAGPPGAVAGAVFGAQVGGGAGGILGGLLGTVDVAGAMHNDESYTRSWTDRFDDRISQRREQKKIGQGVDISLLDQVNEKRALDSYMASVDVEYDSAKDQRHTELEEAGVEEAFDDLWTIQFAGFQAGKGVSVTKRYDTYEEAVNAVPGFVDDAEPVERPSLYTDVDALATVLDALPEKDEDVVVRNALKGEPSDSVKQFLDDEYGSVVAAVGPEWLMENT